MYLTHVHHTVKDYAQWRKAFDDNTPMLTKAGVLGTWIIQKDGDPNDVVVINTWPARKNWNDFQAMHEFKSPQDVQKMLDKGGVIGMPEFYGGTVI
jgi:hypothetical protein